MQWIPQRNPFQQMFELSTFNAGINRILQFLPLLWRETSESFPPKERMFQVSNIQVASFEQNAASSVL